MGKTYTNLFYNIIKDPAQPENIIKLKFQNDRDEKAYFHLAGHVGGVEIAFQQMEVLKVDPALSFIIKESLNCLLEIYFKKIAEK